MGVRPLSTPAGPSLQSSEGELVNVSICVEPRLLERLLDALGLVSFPINPQIYHQAGIGYVYPDGHEETGPATMVEFPAYSDRLPEVRNVLRTRGLPAEAIQARGMIEDLHSGSFGMPAPQDSRFARIVFYRHLPEKACPGAPPA